MIDPEWKKYFYFSKKELKGIIVLGFILLGSVLGSRLFSTKQQAKIIAPLIESSKLFMFDPNKIDSQSAILLGLPEKQVRSLLHYRDKGGRFKNKDDFARLYGLSNETYQQLRPYILMTEVRSKEMYNINNRRGKYPFKIQHNDKNIEMRDNGKVNINSINEREWEIATTLNLDLINRIISYKKYLGVYTSIYQLNKVYGMNDSIFQMIKEHVYLDNKLHELVNANALSFQDWKKLNLFTDRQIWTILKMKKGNNGKISWLDLVQTFDLTEMEAKLLKSKIQLSD